jgi:hypothetical protein
MRQGPADPYQRAPRLCGWLADEVFREAGRRRGEAVPDPVPLNLLTFRAEELLAGLEFAMLWTIACRQTGGALYGNDDVGTEACQELVAFGELLSEAIRGTLAVAAPQVTH